jgi:hypothetical protein
VRARPERIEIERGGGSGEQALRAVVDPARMSPDVAGAISRLLDELRPPAPPDAPEPDRATYDVVLDYGDRRERLRYADTELPGDVRAVLDSLLDP